MYKVEGWVLVRKVPDQPAEFWYDGPISSGWLKSPYGCIVRQPRNYMEFNAREEGEGAEWCEVTITIPEIGGVGPFVPHDQKAHE